MLAFIVTTTLCFITYLLYSLSGADVHGMGALRDSNPGLPGSAAAVDAAGGKGRARTGCPTVRYDSAT